MKMHTHAYLTVLVLTNLLASCAAPMGGGESGTGFNGPVVSSGRITGFGSVYVNGVKFNTTESKFKLDDIEDTEAKLDVGMIVSVHGSLNADGVTGTATGISFNDSLEGIVTSVATVTNDHTIVIMGQTVYADVNTVFKNSSTDTSILGIGQLLNPHVIEVSGFTSGNGDIFASRIELKHTVLPAGEDISIKGLAHTVDTGAKTFMIGSQTIQYSVDVLANITESELQTGDGNLYVEIKSVADGATIVATKVEARNEGKISSVGTEGEEFELEGIVTATNSGTGTIIINAQEVIMPDGFDVNTVPVGTKYEVEGVFNADGILVVTEYLTKEEGSMEITGNVSSIDVTGSTITILGQTLIIDNSTFFKDERNEGDIVPVRSFSISDLSGSDEVVGSTGDWLDLKVRQDALGYVVTNLIRDDDTANGFATIRGIVSAKDGSGNVTAIDGFAIDCSLNLNCTTPAIGDSVEATGTFSNYILVITDSSGDIS